MECETKFLVSGPVPRVPRAIGYGPRNLVTTKFPPAANSWRTKYSIPNMVPHILTKGRGTANLKELNPGMTSIDLFVPTRLSRAGMILSHVCLI
jgi:hypothetical protein